MKFDLIIVGGGLAGAALAVALRASRLSIALVEGSLPARPAGWDTRVYAYSPASADFLRELGVWDRLDHSRLCAVERMDVRGDGDGSVKFSAYQSGLPELAWIGESSLIHCELWESLKRQHNVTVFAPAQPDTLDVSESEARLVLDDGRSLSAALVVGADGRDSWVRQQAGIDTHVTPYDERAVVANLRCEHAHRQTAFQWFREDGVLAWLPLPGNVISMVWSAPDVVAAELMSMTDGAFCERVAEAGGRALGVLTIESPRAAFPLRLMRVESMIGPRVALIGDAAHAIHPLSGHGINLGFQDARALAGLLGGLKPWQGAGDHELLRRYARARAEEPFILQYATHGLNRLFSSRNPASALLRNVGMNLTDRLPVITNALTRYAVSGKF
jgi:ubiquinone biosynthesis UbiH/UbiF/VisC/COQ6 family hydroxylase